MGSRRVRWAVGLWVLGLVDAVATVRARMTWHPAATGPSVATLPQVVGVLTAVALLVAAVILTLSLIRARRDRSVYRR